MLSQVTQNDIVEKQNKSLNIGACKSYAAQKKPTGLIYETEKNKTVCRIFPANLEGTTKRHGCIV